MCVDPSKEAHRRFPGLIPGSRFGRLYSCPYDVAVSYARGQWYLAARVIRPLLASETMRVALMPVPAVLLDLEWQEQRAKRLSLQSGGHSRGRSPPYICSSHHLGFFSCQGFDSQTMARAQGGG